MLPTPPHCATSQPAGPEHGRQVREQRVVVGDPVERGGRQDGVDRLGQRQRLTEVGDDVLDPIAERRQPVARRLDHRRRGVERDHPPAREAFGQQLGDPSAPAARVEDPFVAVERQAIEDDPAPARLRVGDPVVGPGVPVAGRSRGRSFLGFGHAVAEADPRHQRADRPAGRRRRSSRGGRHRSMPGSRRATWSAVALRWRRVDRLERRPHRRSTACPDPGALAARLP